MNGDQEAWDAYWQGLRGGSKDLTSEAQPRLYFSLLRETIGNFIDCDTLEIGCGRGTLSALVGLHGGRPSVLDTSATAVSLAKLTVKKHCGGWPLGAFVADARSTILPDKSYDVVFSVGLLEHFSDPAVVMVESARLARRLAWHVVIGKTTGNDKWWRNDWQPADYAVDGWHIRRSEKLAPHIFVAEKQCEQFALS